MEPYVPGEFYRREMPCLLSMLRKEPTDRLTAVVVDGFVWLGDESTPGLGGHLYCELGDSVPVVGVAKSWMRKAAPTAEVYRGESRRALYVSAAGIDLDAACRHVEGMHGDFRMPTILRRVDRLSRGLVAQKLGVQRHTENH